MTAPFFEDRCWSPDETVLLRNIASTPADDGDLQRGKHVFDALHTPPPLVRYTDVREFTGQHGSGQVSSQLDLLAAIEEGRDVQKTLLFVAGATGAGKSHMVRWMHAQHSATSTDICIHIPRRDTNLVRVVEILVEQLSSHADGLRRLLEDASTVGIGEKSAVELDLVTGLSDYARRVVEESTVYQQGSLTDSQKELQRKRGLDISDPPKPDHVDVVTSGPELEDAKLWEDLIRTGPAQQALTSRGGPLDRMQSEDPDERQLTERDLEPLSRIADNVLAPYLHPLRKKLAIPETRQWVLDNLVTARAMDHAVQRAGASIKADALQKALQDALGAAARAGERVVFFFEDWGTVTGVRSGLLEVFTSMSSPHVAVIADTTDELRRLRDNVADRSVSVFEIGDAVETFALEVTARALNAVRNGGRHLHDADGSVPNPCVACRYVTQCHEAFGAVTVDGLGEVGMFPLTESVVTRAERSGRLRSTPRSLLVDLVRPALEEAPLLDRGGFPSSPLLEGIADPQLRLDSTQRAQLRNDHGEDAQRVERVLRLYRSQPSLTSVEQSLVEAFGIKMHAAGATCSRCHTQPCTCDGSACSVCGGNPCVCEAPRPVQQIPQLARDAERFRDGEAMIDRPRMRSVLQDLALSAVAFGDGIGTRAELERVGRIGNRLFGFAGETHYPAEIRRDDGEAVRALVWAYERGGSYRDQELAHRRRAAATNVAARWGRQLTAELRSPDRAARAGTVLRALAVLRSLTLVAVPVDHPYDLIELALGAPGDRPASGRWMSHDGQRAAQRALEHRQTVRKELLADVALVQGERGVPFGVDVDLLHDELCASFDQGCSLDEDLAPREELGKDLVSFVSDVETAVAAEREGLARVQDAIAQLATPFPRRDLDALRSAARQLSSALLDTVAPSPMSLREALSRLEDAIGEVDVEEDTDLTWDRVSVEELPAIEVHQTYLDAVVTHETLAPRSAVTRAAEALLRELKSLESGGNLDLAFEELRELLDAFNAVSGTNWRIDAPSVRRTDGEAVADHTNDLVARLTTAVNFATSAAAMERTLNDIAVAKRRLQRALDLLGRLGKRDEQARTLGVQRVTRPRPPRPVNSQELLDHFAGSAFEEWSEALHSAELRAQSSVEATWREKVEELRVPDLRAIAARLDDEEAEEAFEEALEAADLAARRVPTKIDETIDELNVLNKAAWRAIERHRGAALDLARKVQEAGGSILVDADSLDALARAVEDGAIVFELRLV